MALVQLGLGQREPCAAAAESTCPRTPSALDSSRGQLQQLQLVWRASKWISHICRSNPCWVRSLAAQQWIVATHPHVPACDSSPWVSRQLLLRPARWVLRAPQPSCLSLGCSWLCMFMARLGVSSSKICCIRCMVCLMSSCLGAPAGTPGTHAA